MEYNYDKKQCGEATPTVIYMVTPGETHDDNNSSPPDRLLWDPPSPTQSSGQQLAATAHAKRPVLRFWALEIASMVIAAGFMAAIWAIIAHYDGQAVPEWSLALNLSTLVSLLAVGFRLALITPIVAVLSQQKWPWLFRQARPLRDLQRIDSASNSVIGMIELLLLGPRSAIAMVSAATLLLALAIGPIAQQAVRNVPCELVVEGANASVPVANYMFSNNLHHITSIGFSLDHTGLGPLLNGLLNPTGNDTAIPASCPTGNCRFTEYEDVTYKSLGLCHSCIDTSSLISSPAQGVYKWPSGENISATGLFSDYRVNVLGQLGRNTSIPKNLWTPEFAALAQNATATITVMALTNSSCSTSPSYTACNSTASFRPLAVTCAMQPCVQRFHGSVVNGQLREELVSSTKLEKPDGPNYAALDFPCKIDNKLYTTGNLSALEPGKYRWLENVQVNGTTTSVPYDCAYIVDYQYSTALQDALQNSIFTGRCTPYQRQTDVVGCTSPWLERFWSGGSASFTSVADIIAQFATATSNHFRRTGSSFYARDNPRPALGAVYTTTVCVSFAWGWLLWPLALYLVAVVLLVIAIRRPYMDREQPIWKASPLPLLFYNMEQPVPVGGLTDEKKLAERAKRMRVEFVREGELGYVRVT